VVEFVIPSSCNCRLEWGGQGHLCLLPAAGSFGLPIGDRSGGVPTATDQSGNEYWAPAATIFPRTEASHVLDER
jgi:hypothetical protein